MRNKLTLLIGLLVLAFAVNAQKVNIPLSVKDGKAMTPAKKIVKQHRQVSKDAVFTEDFSNDSIIAADWQNVDNALGGVWEFNNPGERDFFSTTADNGFAIFDSDNYGNDGEPEDADLISPAIDCSALTHVALTFEHYFQGGYGGQGIVAVSGDNGTTWDTVAIYTASTDNAKYEQINITDYAAGNAEVLVKFNWSGDWSYYWAVDDVSVVEVTANDEFEVLDLTVPYLNTVGSVTTVSTTIRNNGLTEQTKTVSFKLDGNEIGTVTSASLPFGGTETLTFDWTPAAAGNSTFSVDVVSDEDDANNLQDAPVAAATATQLVEGFEGDFLPLGWSQTSNDKSWTQTTTRPIDGAAAANLWQSVVDAQEMLITPPLVLDGSVTTLTYWTSGVNGSFGLGASTLQVKYKAVGETAWTDLGDADSYVDNDGARIVSVDLSSLANGNYYFAFATTSSFDYPPYQSAIVLDDVIGPDVMTLQTVTFTVDDGTDPIEGVNVEFGDQNRTTDASGMAAFGVLDGDYGWTASLYGYYDVTGTTTVAGADVAEAVTMDLMPVVSFTVTDGTDSLAGVNIAIDGNDLTTAADGTVMIALAAGDYDYTATLFSYFDETGSVTLAGTDTTAVDITMTIMPTYTVTFNVTDGTNPIEGATVVIFEQMLTTDASGIATIDLADADYYYVVADSAYLDSYSTVTVNGDVASVDVTLEMIPEGKILFQDDFESYTVGDLIAENSPYWETWSGAAGGGPDDTPVSDAFANSGTQSMAVNSDDGSADMVYVFDKSAGLYVVSFYVYVESGLEGYYNIQETATPGDGWAYDTYFRGDGTGTIEIGGVEHPFTYTNDAWVLIDQYFDLDNDYASLKIDGNYVYSWEFTSALGGIDIYAGDNVDFYVDDFTFRDPLFSGGTVTFNVTDEAGDAVEGAIININGLALTTDSTGAQTIVLNGGDYDFSITADGYVDYAGSITVANADQTVDATLIMQYAATFNLDVSDTDAADFDPATDLLWLSGAKADGSAGISTFPVWVPAQSSAALKLTDDDSDLIYTVTVNNIDPDNYQYKYFVTEGIPVVVAQYPLEDTLTFIIADQDITQDDVWEGSGLNDNTLSGFSIYPNPSNGVVTISTENQCQVTVTNAIGQVVVNRVVNNNEKLDLSNQTQGLYFITAKTNTETKTLRLIIE